MTTSQLREPAAPAAASRSGSPRWRGGLRRPSSPLLWLLACCALLTALPFATAPGDIIADTKFELAVNPHGFLSGAFTLWDPQQFGGLTNQYYGYLFPMGPFFELLHVLGSAGWVTQRLWLAALLLVAFGGTVRLTARLEIGTPFTRLAGGLAYALSPMVLSMAGQTSGEVLPMAFAPWIIVPLTDLSLWTGADQTGATDARRRAGDTRRRARAVARSALAIALCSGTNAASTLAVLVPCAIYILTRPGRRTKRRLLAWWLPAVALISVSWAVPLLLLSKYGVNIVTYTESLQVTSSTTSLTAILRGAENWIGYQSTYGQANRPLAFYLATSLLPAILTGALAALGLAGLAHRAMPERRFLLWTAIGGITLISLGYVSTLGNPLENQLVAVLNGPASPFRNLWKFDPMVRLPIALGLAHVLARPRAERPAARVTLWSVAVATFALLTGATAVTGLASPGSFSQVPVYWTQAADWLNGHAGNQAVLVEPGAGFGVYTWGSPDDDVLSALTNVDFAERNLGVIGSVGNERLLNTIDQDITAGDGSAGLTEVMARMGIKYVLVRNDLAASQTVGTYPARVHDALADSPGLTVAAQFGPETGGTSDDASAGYSAPYPAVQIYQVAGAEAAAVVQPTAGTQRVIGAPESLITLANEGLLGTSPVLLNGDGAGQPVAGTVTTDTLRRRADNFGALRQDYSPTLTATQPTDTFLSTSDYTEPGWDPDVSVARYSGLADVTASSSASDITASATQWATGLLPYAAFDGNQNTMWESGASYSGASGQWLQADLDGAIDFGSGADSRIQVAFVDSVALGPPVTRVTVSTAAGSVSDPVQVTGNPQYLPVPPGKSKWLRITVTGLEANSEAIPVGTQVGIATVDIPGVSATRTIVAPGTPAGATSTVVLAKAQPYQSSCMLTSVRWVCGAVLASPTEEQYGFDETAVEPAAQRAGLSGTAILTDPSAIARYAVDRPGQPVVTATSTSTDAPQDQPWAAFDGNPKTTWVADAGDPSPELTISWDHEQTVSRLTIERPSGDSGPAQVIITGDRDQRRSVQIGLSDAVSFTAMKTSSLHLTFITDQSPVEVSEVKIPGVQPDKAGPAVKLRCGLGPVLTVGGRAVPTKVTASYSDLVNGTPVRFTACSPVTLARGDTPVVEPATDGFDVQDVVLKPTATASAPQSAAPTAATVLSWTSSKRSVRVNTAARSYLEVNENFNLGWQAVLDGRKLQPVQLDGWKQAWVLPAGSAGTVTLTYAPASTYRDAILAGLAALVLCAALAVAVPWRRRRTPRRGTPAVPGPPETSAWSPADPGDRPLPGILLKLSWLTGDYLPPGGFPGAIPQSTENDRAAEHQVVYQRRVKSPQTPDSLQSPPSPQSSRSGGAFWRSLLAAGIKAFSLAGDYLPTGGFPGAASLPAGSEAATAAVHPRQAVHDRQARPDHPLWRRFLGQLAALAVLAGLGLLIGGYPGAVLLPGATWLMLRLKTARRLGWPVLIGGMFAAAALVSAIGEHLVFSGYSGLTVSVSSDTAPQVLCLIVIAGLAASGLDAPRAQLPGAPVAPVALAASDAPADPPGTGDEEA